MGSAQSNPCMALCGEDNSLGQHQQLGDELPDAPEHTDKSLTVEDLVNPQVRRLCVSREKTGRGSCVRRVCNRVRVSVYRDAACISWKIPSVRFCGEERHTRAKPHPPLRSQAHH